MSAELQVISDGDGLAVIGDAGAVDRFLVSAELPSRDLGLERLGPFLKTGSAAAQAGAHIAAQSGRWVKLTEKSAAAMRNSPLMKGSADGVSRAIAMKDNKTKHILEIVKTSPSGVLSNPAVLTGAAGLMAQVAMQQTMDEITDYLKTIDQKLDDVLRAHEDAVIADLIGVGFDIDEAMTLREHGGRVNEVTWSKVQASSATIARTQAYALRQLDALADKVERTSTIADLAKAAKTAEAKAQEWLAVLARCFQLQDAIAVLELDRVLDVAPDDLDGHRRGLKAARQKRLDTIAECTVQLLNRMDAAAAKANANVLMNPMQSPAVVRSRERVALDVAGFHGSLGIESGGAALEAKAWRAAAVEARDAALATGADGLGVAKQLGTETFGKARSVTGKLSSGIAARAGRWRGGEDKDDEG
ncbi:hypothetical protein JKP75_12695 [Blastococcus sp. TML/M2B]|uniref:hypothetical protein n=1 Tax=unclassified Blastococcus TaxID=2619396 RepID=UPI00190D8FCA|nr:MULTISPECIES: hypothetical protein [unclassified Blastococcus]MBN1093343.1 hypothetical protein [Blastococcus sp. TML/M2B]MBN1096542.1 hypothetical protein [Blastococcus sp. TML/C7B]